MPDALFVSANLYMLARAARSLQNHRLPEQEDTLPYGHPKEYYEGKPRIDRRYTPHALPLETNPVNVDEKCVINQGFLNLFSCRTTCSVLLKGLRLFHRMMFATRHKTFLP